MRYAGWRRVWKMLLRTSRLVEPTCVTRPRFTTQVEESPARAVDLAVEHLVPVPGDLNELDGIGLVAGYCETVQGVVPAGQQEGHDRRLGSTSAPAVPRMVTPGLFTTSCCVMGYVPRRTWMVPSGSTAASASSMVWNGAA